MIKDLYATYRDPIYRHHLRLTGCFHTAEELTQETFFQACRSILSYRKEATDLSWLYGIARKVFYRHLRNKKKQKGLLFRLYNNYLPGKAEYDSLIHYADILNELPERYSTVLILRGVERLNHKQISTLLNITEEHSRVVYYRARKKFVKLLKGGEQNETKL